ncbi:MAG: hypothetical protein M3126_01945 [Candidatus Eremiobacteraeota bacterium]|nr:hypothetical protein [Candidatus Eremiobacteraeota bacterium]
MYVRREAAPAHVRAWGEREVRRLLRGLQRPYILESEPLAQVLCRAYELDSPYDAVLRLIDRTFINAGVVGKRLHELVTRCDVDGTASQLAAAAAMNLSTRQFFRYRREAVRALVAQVNLTLTDRLANSSAVEELVRLLAEVDPSSATRVFHLFPQSGDLLAHRLDAALSAGYAVNESLLTGLQAPDRQTALLRVARFCFEAGNAIPGNRIVDDVRSRMAVAQKDRQSIDFQFQLTEYKQATYFGDLHYAQRLSRQMRLVARADEESTCVALLVEIEAALRLGDTAHAEETFAIAERLIVPRRQILLLSALAYYQSIMAFMAGDLEAAESALQGPLLALKHRPYDAMSLEALNGRITLQMGRRWRAPHHLLQYAASGDITVHLSDGEPVTLRAQEQTPLALLSLEATNLRALLLTELPIEMPIIEDLIQKARRSKYPPAIATAIALSANLNERLRETGAAQKNYLEAWLMYAHRRDEFLARDLFIFDSAPPRDLGPIVIDCGFFAAFREIVQTSFPSSLFAILAESPAAEQFWKAAIKAAYLRDEDQEGAQCHHEFAKLVCSKMQPYDIQKQRSAFIFATTHRLAALVPIQMRVQFTSALAKILDEFYTGLAVQAGRGERAKAGILPDVNCVLE